MELALKSTVALENGVEMPLLGLGTYKSAAGAEVEGSVSAALGLGYRSIDTASLYANEQSIASAIRASGIAREELFLTTKVWNDEQGYDAALAACERSLTRLGTDYVDLYLVHWPVKATLASTWRAMEDLYSAGKAKAIGVCNHLPHHLDELLKTANVAPMVDQVEFHPRLQQPALQAYLATNDIVLEAWAPIMRGGVNEIAELVAIGRSHDKTPAQVAIRWILQMDYVAIPKSVHPERLAENADVFDFELTDEEMEAIDRLDTGQRIGPDPDVKGGW